MILSAEHIFKSYGQHQVLRDCSLRLSSGECMVLRGPSGGGKSTLLRILALLEAADRGTICHGERCWDASRDRGLSAYPFLTVVFQQLFLWPNLTLAQNVAIVLSHRPDDSLPSGAMEMLQRLQIDHLLHRHPHECSVGQRQRLAVARALLSPAQFLLLDEPSSALDRNNQAILAQELQTAIASDRGVLLITHDERAYDSIADQLFELENGCLNRI